MVLISAGEILDSLKTSKPLLKKARALALSCRNLMKEAISSEMQREKSKYSVAILPLPPRFERHYALKKKRAKLEQLLDANL